MLKVGDKVWVSDSRRPSFVEAEIVSETKASWVIAGYPRVKVPKRGEGDKRTIKRSDNGCNYIHVYLSQLAMLEAGWFVKHGWRIVKELDYKHRQLTNDQLRAVARIIGYTEEETNGA